MLQRKMTDSAHMFCGDGSFRCLSPAGLFQWDHALMEEDTTTTLTRLSVDVIALSLSIFMSLDAHQHRR